MALGSGLRETGELLRGLRAGGTEDLRVLEERAAAAAAAANRTDESKWRQKGWRRDWIAGVAGGRARGRRRVRRADCCVAWWSERAWRGEAARAGCRRKSLRCGPSTAEEDEADRAVRVVARQERTTRRRRSEASRPRPTTARRAARSSRATGSRAEDEERAQRDRPRPCAGRRAVTAACGGGDVDARPRRTGDDGVR